MRPFSLARATLALLGGTTLVLLGPAVAGAQQVDTYGGGSTVVVSPDTTTATVQAASSTTETAGSSLPFTGGDVAGVAAIGAAAVGFGVLASRARRRRTI